MANYVISGTVFNDYDSDGNNDGTSRGVGFASESGVAGITITAYDEIEMVVGTAITGSDGTYSLDINTPNPVRLEFTLPSGYVSTSLAGVSNDTTSDIAFAATTTTMNLGIHRAHEVTSGDGSDIELITVCYVAGVGGAGDSAIVIHGYNDFDDQAQNGYTPKAEVREIGTVNGLAYHRESETLFAGSFYKRHSALLGTIDYSDLDNVSAAATDTSSQTNDATGAAYTSIIYTVDNSNANGTGNVSIFARLDDVVDPRGAIDSNNFGGGDYNWDTDAGSDSNSSNEIFDAVGKYGLGDLELSPDGTTLWAVNLNDKKLYKLPVGDSSDPLTPSSPAATDIDSYDLITSIVNGGDDLGVNPEENVRPFGLSIRDGLVYLGMVNTAQYDDNGAEGNTTAADLRAFVYTFDPDNPTATPVQVLDIPLDYERDQVIRQGNNIVLGNWNPWVSTWPSPEPDIFYGDELAYPQAILSDIDFDPDGNMILGFRDRWGDQLGNQTNAPDTANNGTDLYRADAGGDILQAIFDPDAGTWSIETHVTTDGINGNNDPDGEFFRNEFFEDGEDNDSLQIHAETAQGGLTVVPGFSEVVTTAYDPLDAFTGGFEWFDTTDGGFAGHFNSNGESGLEIYTGILGKANGLGDIEFISAAELDIEIGNRIWDDTNQDGIQNADETNFDNNNAIAVELYDSNGILIDSTTTTDGEYYFSGLAPFTDYEIRLAASNFTSGAALDGYLATLQNANSDGSDRIDSDAINSGGVPSISFTTGASGTNDYSFDFGLTNSPTTDYGDAPDTTAGTGEGDYQTTAANTGASHTIISDITIGSGVTADDGTLQNTDATADSDDGVTFTSTLQTTDTTFSVDVDVNVTVPTIATVAEDFDTASGYTGGDNWSDASWTDSQNNNPNSGKIRFRNNQLEFRGRGTNSNSYSLSRSFDFSSATGDAILSFRASENGLDAGEELTITISDDIGTTPVSFTIDNTATDGTDPSISPLEEFIIDNSLLTSGATTITFVHDASAGGERVYIDDLSITAVDPNLVGWIDFDQSGTFDSDEAASSTVTSSGTETLTWNSFPGIIDGATYARFRLSNDGELDENYSTGSALNGEVEDYLITVGLDYGDAPDTTSGIGTGDYQTIDKTGTANDGANHGITNGLSIGNTVDPDNGTLQNTNADNDDTDGSDDEDGVTFASNLSTTDTSYSVDVDVTNTTGSDAELIGWIDFDQDGDFETGEASNVVTVSTSGTQTLTWSSISPLAGTTYARFRLSTDTATLDTSYSTGALDDGEVEDYKLTVSLDYGDAPDTSSDFGTGDYQTTANNDGASHIIVSNLSIGSNIDSDDGTLQNSGANADDTDNTADEDGVTFASNLEINDTSYSATVQVTNNSGNAATLVGWIDFDQDGIFESSEAVVANVPTGNTDADVTLTWDDNAGNNTTNDLSGNGDLPSTILSGTTYARFRLSTDSNLDGNYPNGALTDGEVEDYKLTVGLDYGDARDTGIGSEAGDYNTTDNDNGASHIIDPALSIGNTVDADDGTLQNTGATADDDTPNDGSTDDEDGVTFANTLRTDSTSYSVTVDVTNTTGDDAELIGWIDFDQSGIFDSDEAVTTTFSSNGGALQTQTFTWSSIPEDIADGDTYVRFRLSTDSNLDADFSTGQLSDGEVEDYAINIVGIDYGDAPDITVGETNPSPGEYSTTLADAGASHTITNGLKLGATVDAENGTLQNTAADADDLDNNNDDDDEDGVTFNSTLDLSTSSFSVDIDYTNDTGGDAEIIGWIDFDQSGTFDSDEAVSSGTLSTSVFDQSTTLTWNSFPGIIGGTTYARFRINDNITNLTTSTATGELDGGEVEDYLITVGGGTDYGDATNSGGTDSYAATTTSHDIVSWLNIGSTVDDDPSPTANDTATADDNNGIDDEDGVTFIETNVINSNDGDNSFSVEVVVNFDATLVSDLSTLNLNTLASDDFSINPTSGSTNAYGGGTGWAADWTAYEDQTLSSVDTDSSAGRVLVNSNALEITNEGRGAERAIDLSSVDGNILLSFDYQTIGNVDATGDHPLDVFVSNDGGSNFSQVGTVNTNSNSGFTTVAFDITSEVNSTGNTVIRLRIPFDTDPINLSDGDGYAIDNLVIGTPDITLVGWIDFDRDGVFENNDEAVSLSTTDSTPLITDGVTANTLTWTNFTDDITTGGDTYARFRLSNDSNLDTDFDTGSLTNGEVEDYLITINDIDYGDAPDTGTGTGTGNYQTTENDNGAAHIIVSGLSIGSTAADVDNGTLQNTTADADNNNNTDDEDGVDFSAVDNLRVVDSAYSIDVDVINTTGNDAVLVGWIDFDQSGTFDSDEAVTATYSSNGGALQTQTLTWNTIPSDILPGTTYARFRISNDTSTLTTSYSTGLLSSGEVEDYAITIDAADYGDAPDVALGTSTGDYSTTATDGGAAHGIDTDLRLGANLDADSGTLQNDDADADDTDGSPDDEDGVTSTLTDIATGDTSYSITLDVFNNTGNDAKLIGWIDFDRSGTFDSDEAVIRTIPTSATTSSQTLRWDTNGNGFTSSDIREGITYARFRLSTDTTTLTTSYSTGALTDGEVEDYQLNIIGVDYGDAPDDGFVGNSAGDYQTTEENTGASHIIVDDLYLGDSVDADNGTLEDRDAIADDNNNTDDEDGVTFNNILNKNDTSYSVNLVVTNETGSDAKLVGWIDFDQDGDFEATEAVTQTISHAIGGQNTTLEWTGLSGIVGGTTYARFRLTADADLDLGSIQNSDSVGEFDSGEVEDYQIPVQGGVDYGDAPDTSDSGFAAGDYQTTDKTGTVNDGPSHTIVSNLYMGDTVDEDDGSLEGTGAVADDNNGTNDEDGVNFLATLEAGDTSYSVTVDLTNDTGSNATLVGWIDFDQDGNFEATEAATASVSSGSTEQTVTLTWNSISPTAGATYARFRLTTDSDLDINNLVDGDSLGLLDDGEVEDYHLCVVSDGRGGTDGADSITADPAGSVIAGYKGQDTLTGGAGVDHFCYSETSDGVDIINGFTVGSGNDQIILTQILRDEVGYTGTDPIGEGYVELIDYGTTGTMVQIDFDGSAGSLSPKDLALVVEASNADIDENVLEANNLIF